MTRPVVVLGDVNVDLTLRVPDRAAPNGARTLREPELTAGGTAGNTAAALARLGVPVEPSWRPLGGTPPLRSPDGFR